MTDHAVIIGAGPAGLATAACLKRRGIPAVILDRADAPGSAWRNHYDRLHLHTNNRLSHLPGRRFPPGVGRYPSRQDVVDYLDAYVQHHDLNIRYGCEVESVVRNNSAWSVTHSGGTETSPTVIVATGFTGDPLLPLWEGVESFPGPVFHSSEYRSGEAYNGKCVLVVGFGNSGGEIALDLAEHGAFPVISVRNPVNIIPRQLFGIPILAIAIPLSYLPPAVADFLSAPLLALTIGGYESMGMAKRPKGPFRQIEEDGRIPLIDVGTVALLRKGGATVKPEVVRFRGAEVEFADLTAESFDAVIGATGFTPSFHHFLQTDSSVIGPHGIPRQSGRRTSVPGLYFCGFYLSPTGMLREMGIEARRIARLVAEDRRQETVR